MLLAVATACSDRTISAPATPTNAASVALDRGGDRDKVVGGVFAETNDATSNAVVAFARHGDGSLTYVSKYATGGQGISGAVDPLQSQYAVVLTPSHRYLFAVNAGSNSVAAFAVGHPGLEPLGTVSSNGVTPVSVAATDRVLYVLNKGSNTVTGFRVDDGHLKAEPRWTRALSAGAKGAAALRFDREQRLLGVTERLSNTIDVFTVHDDGRLSGQPVTTATAGTVPFGFDWAPRRRLVASEAGSGAASYVADRRGDLTVTSGSPVSTQQAAPCWLITTRDGRFAYVANAGSASITGFSIGPNGVLTIVAPITGSLATGSTPLDLDVSRDSKYLYVLKAGSNSVGVFAVHPDGTLAALPDGIGGLRTASGQMGIAAF
jgi:6-phosphogluconolactonase (cycloisomerase 2 family)